MRRAISQGVTGLLWTAIAFLAVANAYVNFMTAKPLPPGSNDDELLSLPMIAAIVSAL